MATTTIRVDKETHAKLVELGSLRNASLMETVRDATAALHRVQFANRVVDELESLHADPDAWADYLDEGDLTSVSDGVG